MSEKKFNNKLIVRELEISPPIALAPMVGITHSAFRSLVQGEGGVGLLFTEMLAAKRLPHDNERFSPLLVKSESEMPLIYQLITAEEKHIGPAVDKVHKLGADGIDLNLGCPAPVQRRQGAGASLAADRGRLCKVLGCLRKDTELPVSVKIRLGPQLDVARLRTFCQILEAEGVDLIAIHARLNGEKFCRKPRWSVIGEVKDAVSVPVLANGGIFTPDDARLCLEQSGADGLMIGRGAAQQPWLCGDVAREIYGITGVCRQRDRAEIFFDFITLLEERFAPERRLGRLKQFSRYYSASFNFGHHFAASIQNSSSIGEARDSAADFFARIT